MQFKNGYKAILFDLDGTLRHNVPSGADFFNDKARELGMQISDEVAREAGRWEHYYWANSNELRQDSQKFNDDEKAFWSNYAHRRLTALGANPAEIERYAHPIQLHMREKYKAEDWVPPEVHEILPALRDAGFKLGLLSNRRTPFLEQMRELSLDNYFEIIKAAGEIGIWKPNPGAFTPLLKHFDLKPAEAIYIGDNYYADVVGARAAGLEPILYDPRGIFPDADCTRITSFEELPAYL